jgi:hypothetical protein
MTCAYVRARTSTVWPISSAISSSERRCSARRRLA